MKKRLIYSLFFALLLPANLLAVPAKPTPITVTQPDGNTLTININGDESFHYYSTTDGYLLEKNNKGEYCYAQVIDGQIRSSEIKASEIGKRNIQETDFLVATNTTELNQALTQMKLSAPRKGQTAARVSAPQRAAKGGIGSGSYPTTGKQKTVVLLVQFSDLNFNVSDPYTEFNNLLNMEGYSKNGATGSARDYYMQNSNNQYEPEFDVYGPFTLPQTMSYYGGNVNGSDGNVVDFTVDACKAADSEVDFSQYDLDNDGYIDNVYIFYAGYGEADSNVSDAIWPHSWKIYDYGKTSAFFDNVQLNSYACSNEHRDLSFSKKVLTGIGTFCHEFGHVLGLPDFYDTASSGSCFTPGAWEIMDTGSYNNNSRTPPAMSAYSRYYLKWATPTLVECADTTFALNPLVSNNQIYMIQTEDEDEYFLLENRQLESWDSYLPGHGMLIWHIDFNSNIWNYNTPNNSAYHQYIDIEEADNVKTTATRDADAFPGTAGITSFTDKTTPNMKSWGGKSQNKPITNIREEDGIIRFRVGSEILMPNAPVAKKATEVTYQSFTANWAIGENNVNYLLSVYTKNTSEGVTTKEFFGEYKDYSVGNVLSTSIKGLLPETTYYYTVKGATINDISENSNEISLTTGVDGFVSYSPVALSASQIQQNSFTANWEEMKDAQNYYLTVTKQISGEEISTSYDFADRLSLPNGWSTDATNTLAVNGYYGNASPSLQMNANGCYIQTSLAENEISSISFWYRGSNCSESNNITISGLSINSWEVIQTITDISNSEGKKVEISIPAGYYAIRISFTRPSAGVVALDDIVVKTMGYIQQEMEGYTEIPVGSALKYEVKGLNADTDYCYTLRASNGSDYSLFSNMIAVKTDISDGVQQISTDASIFVSGNTISVTDAREKASVNIYDRLGRRVCHGNISDGKFTTELYQGFFIININGTAQKIVVK